MTDTLTRYTLPARALEAAAFAPYGQIIRPRPGMHNQFHDNPYDPETNADEAKLVLTNGQPRLSIMQLSKRGLRFSNLARHRRVSQCLGSLQGKEWFMGFAPPSDPSEEARPDLDKLAAFRIPGDCVVKLHVGTWHAGPQFTHDECLFFNLENMDTNKRDFHQVALPGEYEIRA